VPARSSRVVSSAHRARAANDFRGMAVGPGHSSGTPALRMASRMSPVWAWYVGSSLIVARKAPERAREKPGSSAKPALTDDRSPLVGDYCLARVVSVQR
jgi:hypothetical protein